MISRSLRGVAAAAEEWGVTAAASPPPSLRCWPCEGGEGEPKAPVWLYTVALPLVRVKGIATAAAPVASSAISAASAAASSASSQSPSVRGNAPTPLRPKAALKAKAEALVGDDGGWRPPPVAFVLEVLLASEAKGGGASAHVARGGSRGMKPPCAGGIRSIPLATIKTCVTGVCRDAKTVPAAKQKGTALRMSGRRRAIGMKWHSGTKFSHSGRAANKRPRRAARPRSI